MTDSNVISRHARSRAAKSGGNGSVVLVVALMMALVFVPVLALHAIALTGAVQEVERPAEVANAAPAKAPAARKVPG